jgi:hypothetical protein
MFKKKLSEWSMLPAEVEVTHFYGIANLKTGRFETGRFVGVPNLKLQTI